MGQQQRQSATAGRIILIDMEANWLEEPSTGELTVSDLD